MGCATFIILAFLSGIIFTLVAEVFYANIFIDFDKLLFCYYFGANVSVISHGPESP